MKIIGDYYEEAKLTKLKCLLADLDIFVQVYHKKMSYEEYLLFQRVMDYIADMEVDNL